ncbi:MAG TPA: hypothetical protein VLC28_11515 [Flavitalea sp.]|nr:hypothetical protein [Flavitalea sp.]
MSNQSPLTIVSPVQKSQQQALLKVLFELNYNVEHRMPESFEKIGTIHFARWLVIDFSPGSFPGFVPNDPKLVFASNFDGGIKDQIRDLCEQATDIIDKVYDHCEGYPEPANRSIPSRIEYLTRFMVMPSAFYRGSPGRSVKQIRQEDQLQKKLRAYLDSKSFDNRSAKDVHQELKKFILQDPGFDWVRTSIRLPAINWLGLVGIGIMLLLLFPVIIFWVLLIQFRYERHDAHFTMKRSQLSEERIRDLEQYEDIEFQNQFSQLVWMKPGKVRLITYKAFMLLARGLIRFQFVQGKLMGIPTIHFARWVLFDNDRRVLFFSNFDGSWQQYLGDFIDQSGWGLTGIFSNTTHFPNTKFLITGGAYDEEHFLAWSRNSEIKTHMWYSAYPHLSIKNVNNNSRIRAGIIKDLNEKQASDLLKLI